MNILITSAGRRGYLINYFKNSLKNNGKIVAADCNKYAPALYDADDYSIVSKVKDKKFVDELLKICKENKIKGLISLSDLELPELSKNKKKFLDIGTNIIISSPNTIELCYDKLKTYAFLRENGFDTPKTYVSGKKLLNHLRNDKIKFPLIAKPRRGSASIGIKRIHDLDELKSIISKTKNYIFQEIIHGVEYGIDSFSDEKCKPVCIYMKKKIAMRAGETDKAVSVYNEKLKSIINNLLNKLKIYGPSDIDVIKRENRYYITEINPRFGGGYPLSHALGADFPGKIIKLIKGEKIKTQYQYSENRVMMKQYEIKIINDSP